MLKIIDRYGTNKECEDFSLHLNGWTFSDANPTYYEFTRILEDFSKDLSPEMGLDFVNFNLEISDWYMGSDEAFLFLKDALTDAKIEEELIQQRRRAST